MEGHSGQRRWHQELRDGGWNGLVLCEESREGRLCVGQALFLPFVGREGTKAQRREAGFTGYTLVRGRARTPTWPV